MLGKVLKYELRAGARTILPFFGLALAGSAVLRLLLILAPHVWRPVGNIMNGVAGVLGTLLLVAVLVVTAIMLLARFYRSTVSSEGYLNFTLPVGTHAHLFGRIISATLYSLLAVVVAMLCGIIFIPGFAGVLWDAFHAQFLYMADGVTKIPFLHSVSFYAWLFVLLLLTIVSNILTVYAAVALGSQFGRSKALGGVISYFALGAIEGFIAMPIVLAVAGNIIGHNSDAIERYVLSLVNSPDPLVVFGNLMGFLWLMAGIVALVTLLFGALHYFIMWFVYSKRLNLE